VNANELSAAVKRHARNLGFSDCRIAPISEAPHAAFFEQWLAQGRAGEMRYLERNVAKRRSPALLAEAGDPPFASMLVLRVDYHQFDLPPEVRDDPSRGLIASYAWGDDYHEIIRPLLYELDAHLRSLSGRISLGKCLVDTGPVLERDWALAAGLGFTGKNCCTIVPGEGSWQFLAVLLVPEGLAPDLPLAAAPHVGVRTGQGEEPLSSAPHVGVRATQEAKPRVVTCGQCTRCLVACPTDAFVGAYDLDPRRCISYWTIEAPGPIPRELRPRFGNRIFGCDICQEVCPYNRRLDARTPLLARLHAQANRVAPPLLEGFAPDHPYWLDDAAFSERFVRSPLKRAKRRGLLRNVCVALGNWAAADALPALHLALADPDPLPRLHAAWALGQIIQRHPQSAIAGSAISLLQSAAVDETDERVREEIVAALAGEFC
jgi:epoxyqueuosine reductase